MQRKIKHKNQFMYGKKIIKLAQQKDVPQESLYLSPANLLKTLL